MSISPYQVSGTNASARFTLKIHRGDGMALLAMNWKNGEPPLDFVGFAIEYQEPNGDKFYPLKNRIYFKGSSRTDPNNSSTLRSPIQKFRWVHFPRNANLLGKFTYRVKPVFMNDRGELSYGNAQTAAIELRGETYPGLLNVAFTRGFVSSQAFVDLFEANGPVSQLIPAKADDGLEFVPTHPDHEQALNWMGFEARKLILELLQKAVADPTAQVRVVAYELNLPELLGLFKDLGNRLKIIIDNSENHAPGHSAESKAAAALIQTAGADHVKRQDMNKLQHNKFIVVDGAEVKAVVCGSTNFSWRGFYVQANNALILHGVNAIQPFKQAFEDYWNNDTTATFGRTQSAEWNNLGIAGVDAKVTFSPHVQSNLQLAKIAEDIQKNTKSSLLYSLAFLHQTPGVIKDAIQQVMRKDGIFVYGISDLKTGGLEVQKPNGDIEPVYSAALSGDLPEPFKSEPSGGKGIRMHHKFIVVDFDKPSARVYLGSYNFSTAADKSNGENLVLIKDRRIALSYMIEALRLFDHYHFRVTMKEGQTERKKLYLAKPPSAIGEFPWWDEHFTDPRKILDRQLFS